MKKIKEQLKDLPQELTTPQTSPPPNWLQSYPNKSSIITGLATYVDFDACIFVQEPFVKEILEKMAAIIRKAYKDYIESMDTNVYYGVNQPCLVKYHLDQKYYRGIVKNIQSTKYSVYFIDFGNIEECDSAEMLPLAPFREMPALCTKYSIQGIQRFKDEGKLSVDILDRLHAFVVGEHVKVTICEEQDDTSDSKACTVHWHQINVATEFFLPKKQLKAEDFQVKVNKEPNRKKKANHNTPCVDNSQLVLNKVKSTLAFIFVKFLCVFLL